MTHVVGLVVGLLLVQAVSIVFSQTVASPNVKFDPCTPYDQLPVNKGDDYVIGFAYWPGGVWEDWCVVGSLLRLLSFFSFFD